MDLFEHLNGIGVAVLGMQIVSALLAVVQLGGLQSRQLIPRRHGKIRARVLRDGSEILSRLFVPMQLQGKVSQLQRQAKVFRMFGVNLFELDHGVFRKTCG